MKVSTKLMLQAATQFPAMRLQCWKLGVFSRRISGRVSKNQSRNSSKDSQGSCPPKPKKAKCPLPDPSVCEAPLETSTGRAKGQLEATSCDPDCRKGKPNLPPRGCLPWETGTELCPEKKPSRKLESATCAHLCESYAGQGVIDKLKVSTCEYRRFEKCFDKTKDAQKCLELAPKLGISRKEYPMKHALQKKILDGCPITSHQFVKPKKDSEC